MDFQNVSDTDSRGGRFIIYSYKLVELVTIVRQLKGILGYAVGVLLWNKGKGESSNFVTGNGHETLTKWPLFYMWPTIFKIHTMLSGLLNLFTL